MQPDALATVVQYGLTVWLIAMAAVIGFRLLTHRVGAAGFLHHDRSATSMAPERVQLMGVFAFALFTYATRAVMGQPIPVPGAPHTFMMPEVPQTLLVLLGGSHSMYLAGKIGRRMSGRPPA